MTPPEREIQVEKADHNFTKNNLLLLPYQGEKRIHIVNSTKRYVNKILPEC